MRGFGLTIEPLAGGAVRVALRGELDLEHAYTFDEELRRIEGERPPCVVLDLRGLSFLDSSGLARLLAANRRARRDRRKLLLVRGGAAVKMGKRSGHVVFLDDVIDPRDTRPRLISALETLLTKRDAAPPKKHGNLPL